MKREDYSNLIRHMEWADARIWVSALNVPTLTHDKWVVERLHHYHSTQWAYGQILLKLPVDIPELLTFPDLKSVGVWARRFYSEFSGRLSELDETALSRSVDFPWAALIAERLGGVTTATVGQSIIQLALHSTHHRGQVALHVRDAGGEPPVTDFIAWIWMGCPASEWGLLATR